MILYNGANGGLGRYLGAAISARRIDHRILASRLEDRDGLAHELEELRPAAATYIHLAAMVSVPACEADPVKAEVVNYDLAVQSLATVVTWAQRRSVDLNVIYVSTGHVYAQAPVGVRLTEEHPVGPRSAYARTKLKAERAFQAAGSASDVPVMIARVFGLLSPGQPPNYVLPSIIRRVEAGRFKGIPGLDFARDYLDARDVCADILSLAMAVPRRSSIVVNVCSGEATTIRTLVTAVTEAMGLKIERSELTSAPGRPDDVPWMVGDPTRFVGLTGRAPQRIALTQTISDALHTA